jgi:hypothetical protein
MADVVFDHLVLGASETVPSQALRNTGNAYIVEVKWLGRTASGTSGVTLNLQGSNDMEHWDTLTTTGLTIGTTFSPPYRQVWRLAPGATGPVLELSDAYDYVRLQVANNDSTANQLLSATLDITRYNT